MQKFNFLSWRTRFDAKPPRKMLNSKLNKESRGPTATRAPREVSAATNIKGLQILYLPLTFFTDIDVAQINELSGSGGRMRAPVRLRKRRKKLIIHDLHLLDTPSYIKIPQYLIGFRVKTLGHLIEIL